jgi:coenzyme F420-reducing hydrogenase delta subunit
MNNKLLKISLFYCSNSINTSLLLKSADLNKNFTINTISLSCSGRVNIQYLLKALETGTDGVILVTCPNGECQHVEGNFRAKKRIMAVNSLLKEAGIDNEKVLIMQPSNKDNPEQIIDEIINTCNRILNIPQKGNVTV